MSDERRPMTDPAVRLGPVILGNDAGDTLRARWNRMTDSWVSNEPGHEGDEILPAATWWRRDTDADPHDLSVAAEIADRQLARLPDLPAAQRQAVRASLIDAALEGYGHAVWEAASVVATDPADSYDQQDRVLDKLEALVVAGPVADDEDADYPIEQYFALGLTEKVWAYSAFDMAALARFDADAGRWMNVTDDNQPRPLSFEPVRFSYARTMADNDR